MKRHYRIKKNAQNEFERLTGKETAQLSGIIDCIIYKKKTIGNKPAKEVAYCLYNEIDKIGANIKIVQTCGIDQCVKNEHLVASFSPNKKDADYIKTYIKIDGAEQLAHSFGVTLELFNYYILNTPDTL